MEFFSWLESTGLASLVGLSVSVTASLSAVHLIGFTLVMSGGVVWGLKASGVLLRDVPPQSIARPAVRLLLAGLTVSLVTGTMLFLPRASYTAPDGVFQLKMTLLVAAAACQIASNARVLRGPALSAASLRTMGVVGLALWLGLAVTACWFILFE